MEGARDCWRVMFVCVHKGADERTIIVAALPEPGKASLAIAPILTLACLQRARPIAKPLETRA